MKYRFILLATFIPGLALAASGGSLDHCSVSPTGLAAAIHGSTSALLPMPEPILPSGNTPDALKADTGVAPSNFGGGEGASLSSPHLTTASADKSQPAAQPLKAAAPARATAAASGVSSSAGEMTSPKATGPSEWGGLDSISARRIAATPVLRLLESHGAKLYSLGIVDGMEGVFARNGQAFSVFYISPDGKAAIRGEMWNDQGKNVTLRQVSTLPGVLPTITVGDPKPGAPVTRHVYVSPTPASIGDNAASAILPPSAPPSAAPSMTLPGVAPSTKVPADLIRQSVALEGMLGETVHGTVGPATAPRLWMLVDPMCIYSIRTMKALIPYINAGKLRVSVIPLSVLDYEDQGASTDKARIMVSQPAREMVADWIDRGLPEKVGPEAVQRLQGNMRLAAEIKLQGTPTLLWRLPDGHFARINGVPANIPGIIKSIGKGA